MTTERPILFSGPMVRAILDGRKTQTRRVVKRAKDGDEWAGAVHPDGSGRGWVAWFPGSVSAETTVKAYPGNEGFPCPYGQPGDRLWVRETWCPVDDREFDGERWVDYRATPRFGRDSPAGWDTGEHRGDPQAGRWRPSIHMPRWASRITLEVTEVRVERVQEITNDDVAAEGAAGMCAIHPGVQHTACSGLRPGFRKLWDEINAKRGFGWDENPWVWVVGFRLLGGGE